MTLRPLLAFTGALLCVLPAFAADPTGTWKSTFTTPVGEQNYVYTFSVAGQKLTGTAKSATGQTQIQDGTFKGDEIYFVEALVLQGAPLRIEYRGRLAGDEIRFKRRIGEFGEDEIMAKRTQ